MRFDILADSIKKINDKAGRTAKSAVNQLMTLRNWPKRNEDRQCRTN